MTTTTSTSTIIPTECPELQSREDSRTNRWRRKKGLRDIPVIVTTLLCSSISFSPSNPTFHRKSTFPFVLFFNSKILSNFDLVDWISDWASYRVEKEILSKLRYRHFSSHILPRKRKVHCSLCDNFHGENQAWPYTGLYIWRHRQGQKSIPGRKRSHCHRWEMAVWEYRDLNGYRVEQKYSLFASMSYQWIHYDWCGNQFALTSAFPALYIHRACNKKENMCIKKNLTSIFKKIHVSVVL